MKNQHSKKFVKIFKIETNKENDRFEKNSFDHRNLQVFKYVKRLVSKIFSFLKTLEDDHFFINFYFLSYKNKIFILTAESSLQLATLKFSFALAKKTHFISFDLK